MGRRRIIRPYQNRGHTKIAGTASEYNIGSASFIRIDVPETESQPAFTRIVNPSAVYAINPVTEEVARQMAKQLDEAPIQAWDIRRMQQKLLALKESETEEEPEMEF